MGWGSPYVDPAEARAAAEAAENMERERAERDARARTIIDSTEAAVAAIREGFATLAAAILTAARVDDDRIEAFWGLAEQSAEHEVDAEVVCCESPEVCEVGPEWCPKRGGGDADPDLEHLLAPEQTDK